MESDRHQSQRRIDVIKPKRRSNAIFSPHKRACLSGIPRNASNWKIVVITLCNLHNHLHASRNKCCSVQTSKSRKTFYLNFFEFVAKRFHADPRNLRQKHIFAYFREKTLLQLSEGSEPEQIRRLIENRVSYLNFFCRWIAKPGLVPSAQSIIEEQGELLETIRMVSYRSAAMDQETMEEKLETAFRISPKIGVYFILMAFFGLRPKESVGIDLSECILIRANAPVLVIQRGKGSKGGRPREIDASREEMRLALSFLTDLSRKFGITNLLWPGKDMVQTIKKVEKIFREDLGLMKDSFKGSAYQFRHSFASRTLNLGDLIKDSNEAERKVSLNLGHYRSEVTANYIGAGRRCGQEWIPNLIETAAFSDSEEILEGTLRILLTELFHSRPKLALALCYWVASQTDQRNLSSLRAKKEVLLGKNFTLPGKNEMIDQLKGFVPETVAEDFLIRTACSYPYDRLEKNILDPFDSNFIFKL